MLTKEGEELRKIMYELIMKTCKEEKNARGLEKFSFVPNMAYDKVIRNKLYKAMTKFRIPGKILKLIK